MKDRLIELLYEKQHQLIESGEPFALESYADYLLENGVIVPPCKVGDTVYRVVELVNSERFVVEGIAFEYTETFESGTTKKRIYFWANGEEFTRRNYSLWLEISEFGKTVFLTREKAEQALQEQI